VSAVIGIDGAGEGTPNQRIINAAGIDNRRRLSGAHWDAFLSIWRATGNPTATEPAAHLEIGGGGNGRLCTRFYGDLLEG